MAESVYTRVLARAAELDGGATQLAATLRVPAATLARWMEGKAPMPVQAFLRLIELVAECERAGANGAPAAGSGALTFPMGRLLARCVRCDGTAFVAAHPGEALTMVSRLKCTACGEEVIQGDLIARLGGETVQQARAAAVARAKRQAASGAVRNARRIIR